MNEYEAKQEARRARLEARAERLERQASAAFRRSDLREEASGIPFGQPILVGHHSERRHRRAIERANAAASKSVELSKAAGEARAAAANVGSGGISSDDPDAVEKLREKLGKLEAARDLMREANKVFRRVKAGKLDEAGAVAELAKKPETRAAANVPTVRARMKPDFCGRIGFADYEITNTGAEIRRLKKRIEQMEAREAECEAAAEPVKKTERAGVEVVEDLEANRLRLVFPGKPSAEVRDLLKASGFRWARSEGAWQRQLNNGARFAADHVLKSIEKMRERDTPRKVGTIIHSNGSKWAGEPPDDLETLLKVLEEHELEPRLAPYIEVGKVGCPDVFFGNFVTISHVFRIETDDPEVRERLTAAIRANVAKFDGEG